MATSKTIQERRNAIADILLMRSNVPATVEELATELLGHECMSEYRSVSKSKTASKNAEAKAISGKSKKSTASRSASTEKNGKIDLKLIRLVQRDLLELEKDKLVECHGAYEIDMNGDRKSVSRPAKGDKLKPKALLWRSGPSMRPDTDDLDNLTSSVALQAIFKFMGAAIPSVVREELEGARIRMAQRIKKMPTSDPTVRWLNALVVLGTHHPFDHPLVDEDVRDTIEKAILYRKKVRLIFLGDAETTFERVVSISHFKFMPPDESAVVYWEGDTEQLIKDRLRSAPFEVMLEKIERAELLDEAAEWPADYHPVVSTPEHDGKFEEVLDTYDLRASPRMMKSWRGKWIESQLELIGMDDQGWTVCRYLNHLSMEHTFQMMDYFFKYSKHIEILSPYGRRNLMQGRIKTVAAMYADEQDAPVSEQKRRNAEWFKAGIRLNRSTYLWG